MPDAPKQVPTEEQIDALVEQWFFETFHGSLVAQSTAVWNLVHTAKDDLKHRLSSLFSVPPPS